jgi:hypothetical protein
MAQVNVAALQKKLESLRSQVQNIEAQIAAANKFGNIEVGGTVGFVFGRGENKKNLSGKVLGVGTLENGVASLAVQLGSGLDVKVLRIPQSTVNGYVPLIIDELTSTDVTLAGGPVGDAASEPEAVGTDGTINADALLAGA